VTVEQNSLTKCRRSNNPWHHLSFNHLRLVPSFRGLGCLQAKGTLEFWSVDRCNSFGLCSSNADGSSSFSCSPWWTRLHWIEIVTSLRLQIGKGLCCMQWTGSGGNGKARQLKVFGGANQDSMRRMLFRSPEHWRCILVIVLRRRSVTCCRVCKVWTYSNDHRSSPGAQLLGLVEVPAQCDTIDLSNDSRSMKWSGTSL
jgi:hypothetical protein